MSQGASYYADCSILRICYIVARRHFNIKVVWGNELRRVNRRRSRRRRGL